MQQQNNDINIIGKPFEDFLKTFKWLPGEHLTIISPTSSGKTTLALQLCELKKRVCFFNIKGVDTTIDTGLKKFNYVTEKNYPFSFQTKLDLLSNKKIRINFHNRKYIKDNFDYMISIYRNSFQKLINQTGWTLYFDELQVLADYGMSGMMKDIQKALILSRSYKTSIISGAQTPVFIPRSSTSQAKHIFISYTKDIENVKTLALKSGINKNILLQVTSKLKPYQWIHLNENVRDELTIIQPPKL